jgi:hypothetical protein
VHPEGSEALLRIYELGGIGRRFRLALEKRAPALGARDFYAKVIRAGGGPVLVSLTAVPP